MATAPTALTCTNPSYQGEGGRRQQDAARGGELFHAGRQVRGLPHRRVLERQVVADRLHDDVPGVEADPDLHGQALGSVHLLTIAAQRRLHGQRGVTGAQRMILMRHRGAKERHDAIAQDLIHRAFVAMDGFHHEAEHRSQTLLGVFWIETFDQRQRARDVGKHDGHLFALAFQGGA